MALSYSNGNLSGSERWSSGPFDTDNTECPNCAGEGQIVYREGRIDEDGDVIEKEMMECAMCQGYGNVSKDTYDPRDGEYEEED